MREVQVIAIDPVKELQKLGWTELEAKIYVSLITSPESLTGYQVAKMARVARANVYPVLDRLIRRGAVTEDPESPGPRYQAVSFNLVSQAQLAAVRQSLSAIEENLPEVRKPHRLITAHGESALHTHAAGLVAAARHHLDIGASYNTIQPFAGALQEANNRGVVEKFLCFDNCPAPGCGVCRNPAPVYPGEFSPRGWLMLIKDNDETLIAMGEGNQSELVLTNMEPIRESLRILFSVGEHSSDIPRSPRVSEANKRD